MKKHKDGRPEAWRQGASEKREIQTYSFVHKNDILEGTYLHLVTNVIHFSFSRIILCMSMVQVS